MALLISMDAPLNISQLVIMDLLRVVRIRHAETDENPLYCFRVLLEYVDLDNEIDTSAGHPPYRERAMEAWIFELLWTRPRYASILANDYLPKFDVVEAMVQFHRINWLTVVPRHLVQVLSAESTSPAVFRNEILKGLVSKLEFFALRYWWRTATRSADAEGREEWRALARWIFTDARAEEITTPGKDSYRDWAQFESPLFSTMKSSWDCSRIKAMRLWLEDLASAGVDLKRYGECESQYLTELKKSLNPYVVDLLEYLPYGFTYGSSPDDWSLFMRSEVEAYAGEFWELVEPAKMYIPGGWVDEDDEWV